MKSQRIVKVIQIHPLGTMTVSTSTQNQIAETQHLQQHPQRVIGKIVKFILNTDCMSVHRWIQSCGSEDEEEPGEGICGEMFREWGERPLHKERWKDIPTSYKAMIYLSQYVSRVNC